ncbi:MAG: hypothetical protein GDA50_08325 [Alphaproteobacteria bacterium GM202ARS2]|nr:hypothetical protein [Alphaproteobacteria bacterium GM202ARS2]
MALIAEEVVEEWLNQQGYFTMRGVTLGRDEMDILAVKFTEGQPDLRHYEVQCSINPVSYISCGNARKMSERELVVSVDKWINKKFLQAKKVTLRNSLFLGQWSFYFVVNEVRYPEELDIFEKSPIITVVHWREVLKDLRNKKQSRFMASGRDLIDLMLMDGKQA